MQTDDVNKLRMLCSSKSKHSAYQHIHPMVLEKVGLEDLPIHGKAEDERQVYFNSVLDYEGKRVLDIGANTGYFSFSAIEQGARNVTCYEGNQAHAEFLELAVDMLGLATNMQVFNEYYGFDDAPVPAYDICFCLNVLHHLGDDFGDQGLGKVEAKKTIVAMLRNLAGVSDTLVLQMGFNWKGDRNSPLFESGEKREMIAFVQDAVRDVWKIESIACFDLDEMTYKPVDESNIQRFDGLGEFLNRPIFVLGKP